MRQTIARVLVLVLALAGTANAQTPMTPKKTVLGWTLVAGGVGFAIAAFDWSTTCPSGYSRHTFDNLPTQCVYIADTPPYNSDVTEAGPSADFARPGVLWAGIGMAATGAVLLMIPSKKVQKVAPSVNVTPKGWVASKTITF